jgi:hypothetical protein
MPNLQEIEAKSRETAAETEEPQTDDKGPQTDNIEVTESELEAYTVLKIAVVDTGSMEVVFYSASTSDEHPKL